MKKTILVTGASSGIGKATAKLFHQNGWNVIATMRQPEKEEELVNLDDVLVARLDVLDATSIEAAIESGIKRFSRIDVLLNNAGFGAYGPLEATSIETIERQFDTNVIGLLRTSKAILPHFRANKQGVIVNISSLGGKIAFPLGSLYHGTKFAVEGLSEALSYELEAIGVKVKIIEPGMIRTDFGGRSFSFSNDENIAEYQPLVQKVIEGFGAAQDAASEAGLVAEVIYRAVTDNSAQLRYTAGQDAAALISTRKSDSDEVFFSNIRKQFML